MIEHDPVPTGDEIQSLVDKLVDFDAGLSPMQRSVFRSRILTTMPDSAEVEGHSWEQHWEVGPAGIFRQWIWVDDGRGSAPSQPKSGK